MFNDKYPNILLSASKNLGKTTVIYNMLLYMIHKRKYKKNKESEDTIMRLLLWWNNKDETQKENLSTNIYLFWSTAENDPIYIKLKKDCESFDIE